MEEGAGGVREVRVVMLREGRAKSGRIFTRRALEDVARQAEGLRCFADHPTLEEDQQRPVRSVRDLVGVFHDARVAPGEIPGVVPGAMPGTDGAATGTGTGARVEATLRLLESGAWLWPLVQESARQAAQVGRGQAHAPGAVGAPGGGQNGGRNGGGDDDRGGGMGLEDGPVALSIDALCVLRAGPAPGTHVVEAVPVLKSCDVVTRASAGGRFLPVAPVRESATPAEYGNEGSRPDQEDVMQIGVKGKADVDEMTETPRNVRQA